jgi:hypothetical protein
MRFLYVPGLDENAGNQGRPYFPYTLLKGFVNLKVSSKIAAIRGTIGESHLTEQFCSERLSMFILNCDVFPADL